MSEKRVQLIRETLTRERQKIRDVIESYREFPDEFHVLDGKQGGLLQAIQIIDHVERFGTVPEGFPVNRK